MAYHQFRTHKKWPWLLLSVWLLVTQCFALTHYTEHSLEHEHTHCIVCDFGHDTSASPASMPVLPLDLQHADHRATATYQAPSLAHIRHVDARAPPF
ncbi:hypothetical protein CF168_03875 [Shewanella bicestrii]|uniref:Uncharacterized protein n=1 Tax=Shewanella bicestrii TaxID=2018305 RepID=A0A220UIJ9_9GAMM|nr:hypothetical protein CF168_03875 [Shewanella bicestrii]QXN25744.1 hypothetical protein KVP08_003890 [Shewanella putrefaciens]